MKYWVRIQQYFFRENKDDSIIITNEENTSKNEDSQVRIQQNIYGKSYSHSNQLQFDDSWQGLYLYFRCATIRQKVFHPLFLMIKFKKVIRIYYNEEYFQL
ncbi:hypothetical protein PPERSA_02543 [Pseudocohnilembus persalinus]|uniref:Uncharacterized protein n=1 Tax=Pseudocohnilembus persalinus TaxID=266149 RepID=A0A0V0R5C3_PSEPJ|nr:hypothetical protein PPERSA_02543 [Pseudocohnilembus persalinus]|eukprot:KRX09671.1 hypothetical protein PPERSA_02543 [Pseudocohnilembus persalinus]